MIDLSVGKLLLLAVIALLVLGPEKLPGAARTAGALLRRMRRGWDSVRAEVTRELEAEELRAKLKEAQDATRAAMSQVRAQTDSANGALGNVAQDARKLMHATLDESPPPPAIAPADPTQPEAHDGRAG
ncbi:MAG TPA: Sec-independent protein translocase protein TatB [Rhodanobacteraceae bacterium]|nr:Sec-independent protein translocase protein TatB [Rhodanobacteraceae bacterium]